MNAALVDPTSLIQDVSDTALLVAAYRAMEAERPDALVRDPFAAKLAGERGRRIARSLGRRARLGAWSLAVRTVIIDRFLEELIASGADTIVNLGAGLDTRPYRMELPESLRWIEVDYAHMLEAKATPLASEAPRCKLERVAMDLADVAARRRFFADVAGQSKSGVVVLTEGVLPYLDVAAVGALADDLRAIEPPLRAWIVDYFSPATIRYRERASSDFQNAPFKFAPADWFAFFAEHGWRPTQERYLAEEGVRLGRPIPLPLVMRVLLRLGRSVLPRKRRAEMRRFMGYFVMERIKKA